MRWTYCSGTLGSSKLNTWLTPLTSIPRAAMSVATSTGVLPLRNASSAAVRWAWLLLPWIAAALTPAVVRWRTTRSAPCLVRVKTSARSIEPSARPARSRSESSACFSAWLRKVTYCSTRSAVVACGVTSTRTGLEMNCLPRSAIALGMVALKNRLWRSLGSRLATRFNGTIKPRSIIWSASSSTKISTLRSVRARWSIRSSRRPGVATRMSQPGTRARACLPTGIPPNTHWTERFRYLA